MRLFIYLLLIISFKFLMNTITILLVCLTVLFIITLSTTIHYRIIVIRYKNSLSNTSNPSSTTPASNSVRRNRTEEDKEAYEKNRKSIMENIKVGLRDICDYEITKIYTIADEFVIYEIKTEILAESIRTYIHTIDPDDDLLATRLDSLRNMISKAKQSIYKAIDPVVFKGTIAGCISHGLRGNNNAVSELENAINLIDREYREQFRHRAYYLTTALIMVLLFTILSIVTYTNDLFQTLKEVKLFTYVATAGSIGGFISISRRLKDTVFERSIGNWVFYMYAFERICVAVFASMIVLFIIKSNLAFGALTDIKENSTYLFVIIGVLAGFSETLIPNLLYKLEEKSSK